tara:strand:+ start:266 stop:493 length:228 start_codon:yes stop_codon:yes gene_type:complete
MDALRDERKQITEANGVPRYVVFHDAMLLGMIEFRPAMLGDMMEISGVGQAKLQKYGQRFLDVLQRFDAAEASIE